MFVGFIGAMSIEVEQMLKTLEGLKKEEYLGYTYYLGKRGHNTLVVTTSGIGKVNMAVAATLLLQRYHVDFLINIGTAGSVDTPIGAVTIGDDIRYYDVIIPGYKGIPHQPFPYKPSDYILDSAKKMFGDEVYFGTILSGDRFVTNITDLNGASTKDVVAIDMESAALAEVCYLFSVDYLIIRSISDHLSEKEFDDNVEKSSLSSTCIALQFIDNYKK